MWLQLGMLTTALGVGGLAWFALRPLLRDKQVAAASLPWWWRAAWPWVSAVAPWVGPLCSWRLRIRLTRAIEQAALPAGVSYAHMAALSASAAGGREALPRRLRHLPTPHRPSGPPG